MASAWWDQKRVDAEPVADDVGQGRGELAAARPAGPARRSTCTSRGSSTSEDRKPSRPGVSSRGSAGRATVAMVRRGCDESTRVWFDAIGPDATGRGGTLGRAAAWPVGRSGGA